MSGNRPDTYFISVEYIEYVSAFRHTGTASCANLLGLRFLSHGIHAAWPVKTIYVNNGTDDCEQPRPIYFSEMKRYCIVDVRPPVKENIL